MKKAVGALIAFVMVTFVVYVIGEIQKLEDEFEEFY